MNWRETPMIRIVLPMMVGIWLVSYAWWVLALGLGIGSLLALLLLQARKQAFHLRWVPGILLSVVFLSLGYLLAFTYQSKADQTFPPPVTEKGEHWWIGNIQRLEPTGKRLRAWMQVEAVQDSQQQMSPAAHRILAYFEVTADSRALQAGDVLLLRGKVRQVQAPLNPHQFDYKAYLSYRGVHHQAFVDAWQRIDQQPSLLSTAAQLRQYCIGILRQYLPTADEFSVGAALILGYKAELSEAVEEAYANTGAMHVLAVSGLHVGLVQLLLMALLGKIPLRGRWWRYLRTLLILLGIWGFALITGASPSVLRAATMFSFLAVGQAFERPTNVYNTLAASAFVLLCFNPMLLYHVGFQLSYLAVLGIVYFQPRIYKLWFIENKVGDYVWKLAAVSLAAQIGTLPISLYYFHQFPLYFLLSGLVVVPAAGLILGGGLMLFAVQAVPVLGGLLGQALYGLIYLVNACIFTIEQLPGSLVGGIWIGMGTVLLLYGILACSVLAHRTHRFAWVLTGLSLLVLLAVSYARREWQIAQQRGLTVYHLYKQSAVDHFAGKHLVSLQPPGIEAGRLAFAAEQHRWWRGSDGVQTVALEDTVARISPPVRGQGGFWWLSGQKMLVLSDDSQLRGRPAPRQDLVLLSQAPRVSMGALTKEVPAKLIVADGSNPPWLAERWAEEAAAAGVRLHYTGKEGAWVSDERGRLRADGF